RHIHGRDNARRGVKGSLQETLMTRFLLRLLLRRRDELFRDLGCDLLPRPLEEASARPAEPVGIAVLISAFTADDHEPATSSPCMTWAGLMAPMRESNARTLIWSGSGTVTRTLTQDPWPSAEPAGAEASAGAGVVDHVTAPLSAISTWPPVTSSMCLRSPAAVPCVRYSSAVAATTARCRGSGQFSSITMPDHPASQTRKSSGASSGST